MSHPQLSPGDLVMKLTHPHGYALFSREPAPVLIVDYADPVLVVSEEWLELISHPDHPFTTRVGDLLTIHGSNRELVYRIGEYDFARRTYLLSWPD